MRKRRASITHREAERLLGAMLDGELEPVHRFAVQSHLSECPLCASHLAGLRVLSAQIQAWQEPARQFCPEAFWERLSTQLPGRPAVVATKPTVGRWRSILLPVSLVLCGVFIQASALLTLAASLLLSIGAFPWVASWLHSLSNAMPDVEIASLSGYTWAGWLGTELLATAGSGGAEAASWIGSIFNSLLPTLVFIVFLFVIDLVMIGWASRQVACKRAFK